MTTGLTVLTVGPALLLGAGLAARTVRDTYRTVRSIRAKSRQATPVDYERIAELEREDARWRRRQEWQGLSRADAQLIHLELNALWKQAQRDGSPELHRRIEELTAEYGFAREDEQGEDRNDH